MQISELSKVFPSNLVDFIARTELGIISDRFEIILSAPFDINLF
jgi:hypothetical protein